MLVIELVEGTDLFDAMVNQRNKENFSEMQQAYLLKQLVSAIKHMHDNNIIHRDIKPENIIVKHSKHENDLPEIKVIDFGTSRVLLKGDDSLDQKVGTFGYMAPEILDKNSYLREIEDSNKYVKEYMREIKGNKVVRQKSTYGHKADMWAIGCVAYVLAC